MKNNGSRGRAVTCKLRPRQMTREDYGNAYQRGFEVTYRLLRSRGSTPDRAREVAQAAWARGWERLHQLRCDDLLLTWVNSIALNFHRSLARKEALTQALSTAPSTTIAHNLAAIDVRRILRVCCAADRLLMEQEVGGIPTREIARRRGVSEGAVRISLFRAHRSARSKLVVRTGRGTS